MITPPYDIDWLRKAAEKRWDSVSPAVFIRVLKWALALHDELEEK